jgi:hypothetical protein
MVTLPSTTGHNGDRTAPRSPGYARYAGWQSGLRFFDGRPKPALRAFARPLVALRAGTSTMFWGQARGSPSRIVELQRWHHRRWTRVARVHRSTDGVWYRWFPAITPGRYRFVPTIPASARHRAHRYSRVLSLTGRTPRRRVIVPAG